MSYRYSAKTEEYKSYSQILNQLFDSIYDNVTKKNIYYNEILSEIKSLRESVIQDRMRGLNADKYCPIFIKAMDNDASNKLILNVLSKIKELIEKGFLLGNLRNEKNERYIDILIKTITSFQNINNNSSLMITVCDTLNEIMINNNIEIYGESFKSIYLFLFRTYAFLGKNKNLKSSLQGKIELVSVIAFDRMNQANEGKVDDAPLSNPCLSLVKKITTSMVDILCIRNAMGLLKKKGISGAELPLIPRTERDFLSSNYRQFIDTSKVSVCNELSISNGRFGWCVICRHAANFYCKDSRKPICSFNCKRILMNEEETIDKILQGKIISKDELAQNYIYDCVAYFKQIIEYYSDEKSFPDVKKVCALLIKKILSYSVVKTHKQFINVIQTKLITALVKNSLGDNLELFRESIEIFSLVWEYREHLKAQINVFNESVLLKILSSENASMNNKKVVLEFFGNQQCKYFIELYANYDCDVGGGFLVNRILTEMSKIATRQKEEENDEEISLRLSALRTLTSLIKSIYEIISTRYYHTISTDNFDTADDDDQNTLYSFPTVSNFEMMPSIDVAKIDNNLKHKYEIKNAIDKFNIKPSKGIEYLKRKGMISGIDPEKQSDGITKFLKNNIGSLKKSNVGDFLGDNSDISLKVLKKFALTFDFKGMDIVSALRDFLSTFQLPGEGQKIDRILENFSSKYSADNPKQFANKDCAYYLSFAIMVLQTELHNPNIKDGMKFQMFAKMLDGQNGEKNLDESYLMGIYNEIKSNPISLPELDKEKDKMSIDNKEVIYKRERMRIYTEASKKLSKNNSSVTGDKKYIILKEVDIEEYIHSFMSNNWSPLLAMYGLNLGENENENFDIYSNCINGISYCIRVLAFEKLDIQKKAMLNSLLSLTNLKQIKPIKKKNILIIREILTLSNSDYCYFKGAWNTILELMNTLHCYQQCVTGSKEEKEEIMKKLKHQSKDLINLEKENMEIITKEFYTDEYEKIFNKVNKYDNDSFNDFFSSLCNFTLKEFKDNEISKFFWLRNVFVLVEVNIEKFVSNWNSLWGLLRDFLNELGVSGLHDNELAAVNTLRDLTAYYLGYTEQQFIVHQPDFFRSFQHIFNTSKNPDTQGYVGFSLCALISSHGTLIVKGINILLEILQKIPQRLDTQKELIQSAFQTLRTLNKPNGNQEILKEENYANFLECIENYGVRFPDEVIEVLDSYYTKVTTVDNYQKLLMCYIPLVSEVKEDSKKQHSLVKLFKGVSSGFDPKCRYNVMSNKSFWIFLINNIVTPLMRKLLQNDSSKILEELMIKTSILFNLYFSHNYFLLNVFFKELGKVVTSKKGVSSNAGIECMKYLLGSEKMANMQFLNSYVDLITSLLTQTLEKELDGIENDEVEKVRNKTEDLKEKFKELLSENLAKTSVQLKLFELIEVLIQKYISVLEEKYINDLLECLNESMKLTYRFNFKVNLRVDITNNFMKKMKNPTGLFLQQENSTKLYFEILVQEYFINNSNPTLKSAYRKKIIDISLLLMNWFKEQKEIQLNQDPTTNAQVAEERERTIGIIARTILDIVFPAIVKVEFYNYPEFKANISRILLDLILEDDKYMRLKVKEILEMVIFKDKN